MDGDGHRALWGAGQGKRGRGKQQGGRRGEELNSGGGHVAGQGAMRREERHSDRGGKRKGARLTFVAEERGGEARGSGLGRRTRRTAAIRQGGSATGDVGDGTNAPFSMGRR